MSEHEFGVCPYNNEHKILLFRLPMHIVKCAAKYRGPPLIVCDYNATHRVLPERMAEHLEVCADFHKFNRPSYVKMALAARQQSPQSDQGNNCQQRVNDFRCYVPQYDSTLSESSF